MEDRLSIAKDLMAARWDPGLDHLHDQLAQRCLEEADLLIAEHDKTKAAQIAEANRKYREDNPIGDGGTS